MGTLRKICGRHALLPRSMQIPLSYDRSDTPPYKGGYAEVWKGIYNGCQVAVRVPKVYQKDDRMKIRRVSCHFLSFVLS